MLAWSSPFAGDFNQAVKPIDRDQFQCCEKVLNHTQNRPLRQILVAQFFMIPGMVRLGLL